MIYLISSPNCPSTLKVKKFLQKNELDFVFINTFKFPLDKQTLNDILSLSSNGIDDIISDNNKFIAEHDIQIHELTMNEVIHLIQHEPVVLKKPIIYQNKNNRPYRLLIGFNKGNIKVLLRP